MATVDTKVITAQNERTQKTLTSGLVIVDAAMEPLRVLKVLMEGLGADVKAGLWLTNFRGVPVARTLSPFDLIYLDAAYCVVHCIEISTEGQYAPFRGNPASALVLPPKAIVTSKTRPGDRLQFRAVDESATPPPAVETQERVSPPPTATAPPTPPPQTDAAAQPAHFFNSAFPVPPPQQVGTPLDHFLSARPAKSRDSAADVPAAHQAAQDHPAPAPSGRLTKTTKSVLGLTPTLRPANGAESPSPFYAGSVAHAVEPVGYAAPARVEQRMSAALAAPANLTLPAEAHQPIATPSGRLRRIPHLAPEIVPPIESPEPVAEPTPSPIAQAAAAQAAPATPLPVPQPQREPAAKPTNAVVIPIKQPPTQAPPAESASPEPAPALPAQVPIPSPAAAVPSPIPMLPPAEAAPSFALVPVAKASPAPKPAAAAPAPQKPAPTPVPAPIPLISQPPVRRPSAPLPAVVEPAAQIAPTIAAASAQPIIPPQQENDLLAPAANNQPIIYPQTANPGTPNTGTDLARTGPKAIQPATKSKSGPSWDVKLLYAVFPEFDPSRPPEIRIPRIHDKLAAEIDDEDERPSRKLQILCWLYPHLKLDQVKQRRAEERRAPRLPMPGLVAYFFTGGSPRPHPIKDISVTGFYMQTEERWLPGTVIRVTLQMINPHSEEGRDSVTVLSRVVRWGPDGGGFEFVLPGFMET